MPLWWTRVLPPLLYMKECSLFGEPSDVSQQEVLANEEHLQNNNEMLSCAFGEVIWTGFVMKSGRICFEGGMAEAHLSGSSKRMVAAQWKTMLMQPVSFSTSSGLMARPGCISSLLMGMIFWWKSGLSSRTRSKSCQHTDKDEFRGSGSNNAGQ